MRSFKHIAVCPICRLHAPRCTGHEPELWAIQDQLDEVHAKIQDTIAQNERADTGKFKFKAMTWDELRHFQAVEISRVFGLDVDMVRGSSI